jgi:hypothetical protein
LNINPSPLTFIGGQLVGSVVISAQPVLDIAPPTSVVVGLDVTGTNAISYVELGDLIVSITSTGTILLFSSERF